MVTNWWKNGKLVDDSAFRQYLIIENTTSEDRGIYSCNTVQVYEFGKREQNITFYVKVKGKFNIVPECHKHALQSSPLLFQTY